MSKILQFVKNYRITPLIVLAIIFAYLYSLHRQNTELAELLKNYHVTATLGTPGNYIAIKDVFCLPELPKSHKKELNQILKQYELELHALIYNKQIPENDLEIAEYTLQYISTQCKTAT